MPLCLNLASLNTFLTHDKNMPLRALMSPTLHHFQKMYKGLSRVLLAVIQLLRPTWSKNVRMELKNSDKIYDY